MCRNAPDRKAAKVCLPILSLQELLLTIEAPWAQRPRICWSLHMISPAPAGDPLPPVQLLLPRICRASRKSCVRIISILKRKIRRALSGVVSVRCSFLQL